MVLVPNERTSPIMGFTYPMSSMTLGIVRRARCNFFFVVIVVGSSMLAYILRRASALDGCPTCFPKRSLTCERDFSLWHVS
jgi:hypothetical protein